MFVRSDGRSGCPQYRLEHPHYLELEGGVQPNRPASEGVTPEIGPADAEPFHFPELAEEIQHQAAMNLIKMVRAYSVLNIPEEFGPAEKAAGVQFAIKYFFAQWNVHVNFVLPGLRVAFDADMR